MKLLQVGNLQNLHQSPSWASTKAILTSHDLGYNLILSTKFANIWTLSLSLSSPSPTPQKSQLQRILVAETNLLHPQLFLSTAMTTSGFLPSSRTAALKLLKLAFWERYSTTWESNLAIPYTFLNSVSILEIPFSVRMVIVYYLDSKY